MPVLNYVFFECERCGEVYEGGAGDVFSGVLAEAESEGWTYDEFTDTVLCCECILCPSCGHEMGEHDDFDGVGCEKNCGVCESEYEDENCEVCGHACSDLEPSHYRVVFCSGCPVCKEQVRDDING